MDIPKLEIQSMLITVYTQYDQYDHQNYQSTEQFNRSMVNIMPNLSATEAKIR